MKIALIIAIYIFGSTLFVVLALASLRRKVWYQCRKCGAFVSDYGDIVFEKPIELTGKNLPKTLCEDCWMHIRATKKPALSHRLHHTNNHNN